MWTDILKGKRERPNIDTHKKKKTEKKEQKRLNRNRKAKLAKKKRLIAERAKKVKRAFAPHVGFDAKLLRYKMVLDPLTPTFDLHYEMSYKGRKFGIIQLEIFPDKRGLYPNGDKLKRYPSKYANTGGIYASKESFKIRLYAIEAGYAETFDERLEVLVAEFLEEYERMRTTMPWAMDKKDHWKEALREEIASEKPPHRKMTEEQWRKKANIKRRLREKLG